MEITNELLDDYGNRVMAIQGIDQTRDSFIMIEHLDGILFMKFMSDGGITDGKNGHRLHELLQSEDIQHEYFDSRKFFIQAEDLQTFLGRIGG